MTKPGFEPGPPWWEAIPPSFLKHHFNAVFQLCLGLSYTSGYFSSLPMHAAYPAYLILLGTVWRRV
jgi:hypothetical protein